MPRRPLTAPLALGSLLLAGCAQPGTPPQPIPVAARSYVCRPSDAPATPGSEQHITVRADDQRTGMLLKVGGQSNWRTLAVIAGSADQVYADATYAWRANGAGGVLTDVRSIQTYNCTADAAAAGPAK